jgi:hypothetical protein
MCLVRNQEGAALVTALMLTMLSLVIAMALLSTVISGIGVTASQKRYRSALSAAHGGVELIGRELIPRLFEVGASQDGIEQAFSSIDLQLPQYDCLRQKLSNQSAHWGACSAEQTSSDPGRAPDVTFRLASNGRKGFSVAGKIVDTIPGNSDKSGVIEYLDAGGAASSREEVIRPRHVPGLYNLSVQGEREGGAAQEKARLSVLYSY